MALPAEFIYFTRDAATGKVTIYATPSVELLTPETLEKDGIQITKRRPCIVRYRGDVYVAGCYSRPVYYPYRDPRWVPVGIAPPGMQISVAAGGATGGATGTALCYVTHQHRAGPAGEVLLGESNPSNVVLLTLTGTGRAWSGLASPRERRVTHVAGYCSVNGSNYRRAFLLPYGPNTYSENLATADLTIQGPEGNYLPPMGCAFIAEFAGRMWYANTSEHPYRLWYSKGGDPQSVPLANVRDTLDRDPIVGMRKVQNILVVGTRRCMYGIREAGGDFSPMEKLDSSIGLLSHFGMLEIHNKLWFPSHDGVFLFDGAGFYFAMKDVRPYWLADRGSDERAFDASFAVDDRIGKNYFLLTNRSERPDFEGFNPGTVAYVGNYLNFERTMGGTQEQPDWSLDCRSRFDYAAFYGLDNVLYFGSEDGKIRNEDASDGDDDGDTLGKDLMIERGCQLFGEPGDDPQQGKKLDQLWAYIESETTAWSCYVMMGDEWAGSRVQPDNSLSFWKVDVVASDLTQPVPDPEGGTALADYIPETVHYLGSPEGVSGRGLVLRYRASSPVGLKYRGEGGIWSPSVAPRLEEHVTRMLLSQASLGSLSPNTAATPYLPVSGVPEDWTVTLSNADLLTYPFDVSWQWAGAHVEARLSTVASGLVATESFILAPGVSTLTISITIGANTMTKTYHFDAS